jgi:hypothetical protein
MQSLSKWAVLAAAITGILGGAVSRADDDGPHEVRLRAVRRTGG